MNINIAFEGFIHKHKRKGNRDNTREDYYYHLLPFLQFLGPDFQVEDITTEIVLEYVDTLPEFRKKNGEPYSDGSISSFLRTLKIFCRYLNERCGTEIYIKDIPNKAMPARDCPIYTDEEFLKILGACKSPYDWISARNELFVVMMYDSGLRQIEVTRLNKSDIDFSRNRIKVFGKGDKYRYVPCGNTTKLYILK